MAADHHSPVVRSHRANPRITKCHRVFIAKAGSPDPIRLRQGDSFASAEMTSLSTGLRLADYRLSDEQQALSDVYVSFFSSESTSERVRAAEPVGFDPGLW